MVSEGGRRDDPHVPLILKFSWKVVCESHGILTIQGVVKEWVVQCSSPGLLEPLSQQRGCW